MATTTQQQSPASRDSASRDASARRVFVMPIPFAEADRAPLDLLETEGIAYETNTLGRKLRDEELLEITQRCSVLVADTTPITRRIMEASPNLRLISRVGIGLDSVDLVAARELGIHVSHTPDAPAPAVAEFTIGLMLSLLRGIPQANHDVSQGHWQRTLGRRLAQCTVGIIGVGRIGKRVIRLLQAFGPTRILANDLAPDEAFGNQHNVEWTDKETIYREADVLSLHVPLTNLTRNLVTSDVLNLMSPSSVIINTARGNIIDEAALAESLRDHRIAGAAIDTFDHEPYTGPLASLRNCITTPHIASMTRDCRLQMELQATEEAVRFVKGDALQCLAAETEYALQMESLAV